MKNYLYLAILLPFLISACNLINPKEEVPTYLHLEPFIYTNPDSSFTGSSFQVIPSAAVFVDDIIVGTFDLPCTIPVITSKNGKVIITPQVTNQGLKSYVFRYPFFTGDTTTLIYNPGKIQNYTPKTRYSPELKEANFKMKINFEEGLLFKNLSGDTTIVLESDASKVLEGEHSGLLYLDQNHKTSECISTNYFERTEFSTSYMEFDYSCSIPFAIGLQAEDASGAVVVEYLAGFYSKTGRNKIYLDLATFIKKATNYNKFYITIRANLNDEGGKYKEGYVVLDNIKVISK